MPVETFGVQPSGPVQLLRLGLLVVLGVFALWFWGSVFLRFGYELRRVPDRFDDGREKARNTEDEKRER